MLATELDPVLENKELIFNKEGFAAHTNYE
jgi:hypothetical protein